MLFDDLLEGIVIAVVTVEAVRVDETTERVTTLSRGNKRAEGRKTEKITHKICATGVKETSECGGDGDGKVSREYCAWW